nr:MAG TPA: hypothetical protein [Caudoviricetes sp.]
MNVSEILHQLQCSAHTPTVLPSVWNDSVFDCFFPDFHCVKLSFAIKPISLVLSFGYSKY